MEQDFRGTTTKREADVIHSEGQDKKTAAGRNACVYNKE